MGQIKRAKQSPFNGVCLFHIAVSGSAQSLARVVLVCELGSRTQRSRAANEDTQSALRQDSCKVACEILTVAPPPPDQKGGEFFFVLGVGR